MIRAAGALAALAALLAPDRRASAGPPFLTDDPEPVAFRHWELYLASQGTLDRDAAATTAPHVEVNYGVVPNLQLHAIVPAVVAWTRGAPVQYGPGDVELGAKLRFVQETDRRPQIGTFPLLQIPAGSAAKGLGAGVWQALLPLWIQKSFGRWTTYGGGGVRIVSGGSGAVAGWLVERELAEWIVLGTEAYLSVPFGDGATELRLNLGLVGSFSPLHHLLASGGPAFGGGARVQGYLAYLLTI